MANGRTVERSWVRLFAFWGWRMGWRVLVGCAAGSCGCISLMELPKDLHLGLGVLVRALVVAKLHCQARKFPTR